MIDTSAVVDSMADSVEARLLELFGSYENAVALAHLYVIEWSPLHLESVPQPDGTILLRAMNTWRLRLKTEEERDADDGVSQNQS